MPANFPRFSFPDKQRERRRVAVKKIAVADRANFAIAEKPRQPQRPQLFLDPPRVVVRLAEEPMPAPVATAQAAAVDPGVVQALFRAREQRDHVLGGRPGVASLELKGLALPRQGADGDRAGSRVCAEEISNQKIPALEFLEVF